MTSLYPKPSAGEHTKGPWKAVTDTVHTVAGAQIADCSFAVKAEANARRIVACVNACGGIATDTLENISVKTLLNIGESNRGCLNEIRTERDALAAQNRELVEALDWAMKRINRSELGHGWSAASIKYDEIYSLLHKHGR